MSKESASYTHQIWFSLIPMLLYAAILPYTIFRLASPYMPTSYALLLAAIPPATGTLVGLIRNHNINLLGILALMTIVIKLVSGLVFKDPHGLLLGDSLMTGVYGILMLGSLMVRKPLLLSLARSALASAPAGQKEEIERRWLEAGHPYFTFLTALWGTGLLLALVASVVLIYTLAVSQYMLIGPIIQYSAFGALLLGTQILSRIRRYRKARQAEQAQGQTQVASI